MIKEKVLQSVELLREFGVDCWITFTRESGINGDPCLPFLAPGELTWHSAFIISADGRRKAIVGRWDAQAIEETGAYDEVTGFVTSFKEPFQAYLKALNPARIAVNYSTSSEVCDGLTHGLYLTLVELLSAIGMADRLVSAEQIVSALRERKSAAEIARTREAVRVTEEIFALVRPVIQPGTTERAIAAFILAEMERRKSQTAWGQATCPSVFSGPDTAEAHYAPTGRTVKPGHLLNIDFGVRSDGYCSDLQRTYYLLRDGEATPPESICKALAAVTSALESARHAMKPGAQGIEVDTAARKAITRAGFEEFPHAVGHQVGRFVHDGNASLGPAWEKYGRRPFQRLEENMVFAVEPRVTVPGHGIVTIEEMVLVTRHGAEWISTPQKELLLVR